MIQVGDFRRGMTFVMDGDLCEVVEFQHVKPGKGAAFVRTKIRNINSGTIREVTLNPSERYERAIIESKEMQYLYNDGDMYYFMDIESYDQIPITKDVLGDAILYIKDNDTVNVKFHEGRVLEVEPDNFVELEVTQTEPGLKGDTSSGATKPATLETGLTLNVPLFIDTGDKLRIDSRTGEYESRA